GARYDVRRSELNVQENPILDVIDAKKNILTLDQTKSAQTQLEVDAKSRQDQFASQLAVYQEQRNRSLLNVTQELNRIAQTKSLSPMTGLVAILRTAPEISTSASRCPRFGKATRSSRACRWPTCWTFPKWKYGPKWASSTAPT